jgi:hypothetical protein
MEDRTEKQTNMLTRARMMHEAHISQEALGERPLL